MMYDHAIETTAYMLASKSGRFSPILLLVAVQGHDGVADHEQFNCHVTVWPSDKSWESFVIRTVDSGDGCEIFDRLPAYTKMDGDADALNGWCHTLVFAAHDPDAERPSQRLLIS